MRTGSFFLGRQSVDSFIYRIPLFIKTGTAGIIIIGELPNAEISINLQVPIRKTRLILKDSHTYDEHIYSSESVSLEYYAHAFEKGYPFPLAYSKNICMLIKRYDPDMIIYEAEEFQLRNADHFGS